MADIPMEGMMRARLMLEHFQWQLRGVGKVTRRMWVFGGRTDWVSEVDGNTYSAILPPIWIRLWKRWHKA